MDSDLLYRYWFEYENKSSQLFNIILETCDGYNTSSFKQSVWTFIAVK